MSLSNDLQFLNVITPYDEIKSNFDRIKSKEDFLKQEIKSLLADDLLQSEITSDIRENLEKYTSKSWQYFSKDSYFEDSLNLLYSAMYNYSFLISRRYFLLKKTLLNYQEELEKKI